jgi:hypothetical protein
VEKRVAGCAKPSQKTCQAVQRQVRSPVSVLVRPVRQCVPVGSRPEPVPLKEAILLHMIVRAAVVIFYLVVVSNRSINMQSEQQYERDAKLIKASTCPVCMVKVGRNTSRHALVQHFHRKKQCDIEHALYMPNYKQHFKHGRSKKPARKLPAQEVAKMLRRHVGQQFISDLLRESIVH